MFKTQILLAVSLIVTAAMPGQDPPPSPAGFNGTLVGFNDSSVTVRKSDGATAVIQMTPNWTVSILRTVDAAAIKAGAFVASQNQAIDANSGKATELRILEPGYRPEEGTHGMAGSPNMMTHSTVSGVSTTAAGVEVTVTYANGSRRIRRTLKPGATVSGVTRVSPDGVPRAGRLVLSPRA